MGFVFNHKAAAADYTSVVEQQIYMVSFKSSSHVISKGIHFVSAGNIAVKACDANALGCIDFT